MSTSTVQNVCELPEDLPLVSVIITTYNYAAFLPKAIDSVLHQSYTALEILVIDDGSTDETAMLVARYPEIKYHYQENSGLSAARNAGIALSKGSYLVFLDADDWLESDGIVQNLAVLKENPGAAFISGSYNLLRAAGAPCEIVSVPVEGSYYQRLLSSNYIGMHGAVMYQRWVLQAFTFDASLKACEDYDLYLRITRQYPVLHHQPVIATYYFHSNSLSHHYGNMIYSINRVLEKQRPFIRTRNEKRAYRQGLRQWKDYYCLAGYAAYSDKMPLAVFANPKLLGRFLLYNRTLLLALLQNNFASIAAAVTKRNLSTSNSKQLNA